MIFVKIHFWPGFYEAFHRDFVSFRNENLIGLKIMKHFLF